MPRWQKGPPAEGQQHVDGHRPIKRRLDTSVCGHSIALYYGSSNLLHGTLAMSDHILGLLSNRQTLEHMKCTHLVTNATAGGNLA